MKPADILLWFWKHVSVPEEEVEVVYIYFEGR
jgi:hypothetical protein